MQTEMSGVVDIGGKSSSRLTPRPLKWPGPRGARLGVSSQCEVNRLPGFEGQRLLLDGGHRFSPRGLDVLAVKGAPHAVAGIAGLLGAELAVPLPDVAAGQVLPVVAADRGELRQELVPHAHRLGVLVQAERAQALA